MTISELTDYLQQFPANTRVIMSSDDITEPGEFVALDVLNYDTPCDNCGAAQGEAHDAVCANGAESVSAVDSGKGEATGPYPRLSEAGPACVFLLSDTSGGSTARAIDVIVEQESGGISLAIEGTPNGDGHPVFIEWRGGYLNVHVWADNKEDPTDSIQVAL